MFDIFIFETTTEVANVPLQPATKLQQWCCNRVAACNDQSCKLQQSCKLSIATSLQVATSCNKVAMLNFWCGGISPPRRRLQTRFATGDSRCGHSFPYARLFGCELSRLLHARPETMFLRPRGFPGIAPRLSDA